MIDEIFGSIIDNLKNIAPIAIVFNIGFGIALLFVGVIFLRKQQQTKRQKIGGWICVSFSVLAFLGAVSNWFFSYIIF